ncbi:Endonuclease III [Candidatus Promineifilum breve]|uniref:Endonuclease III n=1 Tax=Candidatus Promineifilum breve TaxID=1806508 RepID=A0A160T087_9CHLR|nr:endonuclease III [Candidatus Promineifilum breve]CUS02802.2 Endonuclease III [Candidatus Promineifilum breve]
MSIAPPKQPLDIDQTLALIRAAVAPYPKAAMFELAELGYATPFEQLIACIISIRTRDEDSLPISRRLLDRARTPAEIAGLSPDEIDQLITPSTFHERKAVQIQAIARQVAEAYGGELPCDEAVLLSFSGVGVKCAHLALGIACDQPWISVDIHVHRVTNRWGYVAAPTPERTMLQLEEKLPREHWVEINRLLVPFGKHICTGQMPRCSTCPVLNMCQQVGVTQHR